VVSPRFYVNFNIFEKVISRDRVWWLNLYPSYMGGGVRRIEVQGKTRKS
jgi:hypothetical protein